MRYRFMIATLVASVHAHTWVEQLNIIAANGTMVGDPGFPRGNVKRGTPGFGDPAMVNLIPPNPRPANDILPTDLMCKSSQVKQQQGDGARLKAPAGANVALRYQENGHVTLPQNQPGKPENRGTVFVYGTTEPREDDKFTSIHRIWNADGTGGDKRGVLLSTQNFDDSQCYQVNGGQISSQRQKTFSHTANSLMGADLWCQQDIQLPKDAPSGKPYTLYWVWDWPTMPGTPGFPEGKQEIYTTCMDVDITPGTGVQQKAAGVAAFVKQDLVNAAVQGQFSDIANPTAVVAKFIPFSGVPNAPTAAASSATSSAPSSVSSISAPSATSQNGRPFRTRPVVSPVGTLSPPYPQSSSAERPSGQVPSGSPVQATGTAQNTGTAISKANVATVTVTANANEAVSTVVEMATVISTVVQTKFETVYPSKRAETTAVPTIQSIPRVESISTTESAYLLRARNFFIARR